jgi:CBS domain-containing protein
MQLNLPGARLGKFGMETLGESHMKVGEVCNREVAFVYGHERVSEAAKVMREHHVGSLVVVAEEARGVVPIGILTDRDIVVEVLTAGLDYGTVSAAEIMSRELITVREEDDVLDAFKTMRSRGIRRLPVLTRSGTLAGIVTIDDLLALVAEQVDDLVKTIASEQSREARSRA